MLHLDLKSAREAKVCDFGLSRVKKETALQPHLPQPCNPRFATSA